MKKLLLILLFICAVGIINAQNDSIILNLPDLLPESNTVIKRVPPTWKYRPYTNQPVTIGDLLEYKTWCYNDSTAGAIETLYRFNKDSKEYEAVSFNQEYYHLHYPQFDEFINWMEEKYKEK